jgi:hypothetical protein
MNGLTLRLYLDRQRGRPKAEAGRVISLCSLAAHSLLAHYVELAAQFNGVLLRGHKHELKRMTKVKILLADLGGRLLCGILAKACLGASLLHIKS